MEEITELPDLEDIYMCNGANPAFDPIFYTSLQGAVGEQLTSA